MISKERMPGGDLWQCLSHDGYDAMDCKENRTIFFKQTAFHHLNCLPIQALSCSARVE
jgi:hypothetical protein